MLASVDAPAAAVTAADLQDILETTPFTAAYGFKLGRFSRNCCEILVPYIALFERPGGIVSGQAYMTAADVAAWFAIKTVSGAADRSVTIEMTTSFLDSLQRGDFVCRAEVMKAGKTATFITAQCSTTDGRILTHHTIRYLRPVTFQP